MKYETVRAIAKDGDIIFLHVNEEDFLSRVTSWFTKSPYTHAAFVFSFKERLMVVESTTHGGQRIVNASIYADRKLDLVPAIRPWEEIEEDALSKIGMVKYGWFSAIWLGLRDFCSVHFDWKLPPDKKNRNKACSEFVAEKLGLEDVDLSPRMLYNELNRIHAEEVSPPL